MSKTLGGMAGAAVALFLLVRLQAFIGIRWELVVAIGTAIIVIVSVSIVADHLTRRSLKRVAVDDRFLYVSDYSDSDSTEVAIPVHEIVRVTQWRGKTLRPVSVYLRSPSPFGTRIRFQPKPEWGFAWSENTVVDELRKLATLP